MSKVITPHFEQVIERFIATGRFNNKSEVIRAGLRLLEEHELHFERATRADLERILDTTLQIRPAATNTEVGGSLPRRPNIKPPCLLTLIIILIVILIVLLL